MTSDSWISRRDLLKRASKASALAAVPLPFQGQANPGAAAPAPSAPAREPLENLTPAESDVLEAVVARLVPGDATSPGAAEARAAHYIDRALGGALASSRETYRQGLAAIDALAVSSRGDRFARLSGADQDAVLQQLEADAPPSFPGGAAAFFTLVLGHTLQGTFGDPHYGGNRNFVGWDLLGYPGIRLAVTADQQRLGEKPSPTHMSAYDYTMFSGRRPARAGLDPHTSGNHGD
jgi:gluconate 2-dehydrogenase gamma chain